MRTSKQMLAVAAALTMTAGMSACSGDSDSAATEASGAVSVTTPSIEPPPSTPPMDTGSPQPGTPHTSGSAAGATETAHTVIATAEKAVKGGTVYDLEHDDDSGDQVWDVKVAGKDGSETELDISSDGGTVVRQHQDDDPDDDIATLQQATVPLTEAIDTAAGEAQGAGDLYAAEIDTTDQGMLVWQVTFGGDDGITVLVDASKGSVVTSGPDVG